MTTKETYRKTLIDHFSQNFKNSNKEGQVRIENNLLVINFDDPLLTAKYIKSQMSDEDLLTDADIQINDYLRKLKNVFEEQIASYSPTLLTSFALAEVNMVRIDIGRMMFLTKPIRY